MMTMPSQYADEEVSSNYTYPPEYHGPKSIKEQMAILLADYNFPELDPDLAFGYYRDVYPGLMLPDWVEGAFVVPAIHALVARFFPKIKVPAKQYCAAVNLILAKLDTSRKFCNYRVGQITPTHLHLTAHTTQTLTVLAEQQPGDFWVIPSQFGLRHRGRSVRRVREVMSGHEFGGYTIQAAAMLLTHPERLVRWEQLHIDLPGEEFRSEAAGQFDQALFLSFGGGLVKFDTGPVGFADPRVGSVSGFLPPASP